MLEFDGGVTGLVGRRLTGCCGAVVRVVRSGSFFAFWESSRPVLREPR
jgi:hypothetical protein